ncbi:hypothetical protein OG735_13650 [Streptomyces sp. NBC_01210]|uniref:hypothetical protein n=1 Tax=Streptomyces sp. NBC_01210 TaxID=2903774 RepID=UPI002E13C506|nr:hypothetical protein OG735_13650 [Streptomyces sp. NBC_01210]
MILILGLIVLIAAVTIGVVGVFANSAHGLSGGFSVFGYEVTGSTGTLFLYGIAVGAAAVLGLALLLIGARRAKRRSPSRRGLTQSRGDTPAVDRERHDQISHGDTRTADVTRAQTEDRPAATEPRHRSGMHWFGHRSAPR